MVTCKYHQQTQQGMGDGLHVVVVMISWFSGTLRHHVDFILLRLPIVKGVIQNLSPHIFLGYYLDKITKDVQSRSKVLPPPCMMVIFWENLIHDLIYEIKVHHHTEGEATELYTVTILIVFTNTRLLRIYYIT